MNRLLIIELDPPLAGHLVVALKLHGRWCRAEGFDYPAELDDLEAVLSATAAATARQDATVLADHDGRPHPARVLLLRFDEAAVVLGVSKRTVERLVAAGELPTVDVGERTRRIHRTDVEEFARRRRSTAERPASPDALRQRARFKGEGAA